MSAFAGGQPAAPKTGARSREPRVFCVPVQDVQIGGRMGNAEFQYTMQGDNLQDLLTYAPLVEQKLRTLPEMRDVNSDLQNRGLQAGLVVDRDTASRLGITAPTIDNALYDAFGQRQVSTMYEGINQYHVVMEIDPKFQQSPDALENIYVKSNTGRVGATERVYALRSRRPRHSRSTTRGNFLRSRFPSIWRPTSLWETR